MEDIYGNKAKNLRSAVIVSSKEAERLRDKQVKEDKIRVKYGLNPIIAQQCCDHHN